MGHPVYLYFDTKFYIGKVEGFQLSRDKISVPTKNRPHAVFLHMQTKNHSKLTLCINVFIYLLSKFYSFKSFWRFLVEAKKFGRTFYDLGVKDFGQANDLGKSFLLMWHIGLVTSSMHSFK